MDFVFDGESIDSSLDSLSKGFKCTRNELEVFLAGISEEEFKLCEYNCSEFSKDIFWKCCQKFEYPTMGGFYVFHLTRAEKSNDFEKGLLPLNQAKEILIEIVERAIPAKALNDFMEIKNFFLSKDCKNSADNQGPSGFLIREEALFKDKANFDFPMFPEIVKDGCDIFEDEFNYNIEAAVSKYFEEVLVGKIVKFYVCNEDGRKDFFLEDSLMYYVWLKLNDLPLNHMRHCHFNTYSNNGVRVEVDDISKVENLDDLI